MNHQWKDKLTKHIHLAGSSTKPLLVHIKQKFGFLLACTMQLTSGWCLPNTLTPVHHALLPVKTRTDHTSGMLALLPEGSSGGLHPWVGVDRLLENELLANSKELNSTRALTFSTQRRETESKSVFQSSFCSLMNPQSALGLPTNDVALCLQPQHTWTASFI